MLSIALCPTAADLVARGPNHLGVVPDLGEIVLTGLLVAVGEEPLLGEPRLYGEEPGHIILIFRLFKAAVDGYQERVRGR